MWGLSSIRSYIFIGMVLVSGLLAAVDIGQWFTIAGKNETIAAKDLSIQTLAENNAALQTAHDNDQKAIGDLNQTISGLTVVARNSQQDAIDAQQKQQDREDATAAIVAAYRKQLAHAQSNDLPKPLSPAAAGVYSWVRCRQATGPGAAADQCGH